MIKQKNIRMEIQAKKNCDCSAKVYLIEFKWNSKLQF